MDWEAGKSYYTGYSSIDRFDSIIFFHNYFYSWSIGIIFSLILPLLFLFAPSSLHTNRTSHFLIICLVCLSNMFGLYIQPYMLSGSGEPNLSFHTCRFIVYLSTFAKPIGIYLTLLFSIERLFTKILSKFILRTNTHRQLFKRFYSLFIFIGIILILSIRLYEVLKYIKSNLSVSGNNNGSRQDIVDVNGNFTFQYCYHSMDVDTYAKILSFYVIQYWFEYVTLGIISLILLGIIIHQFCLSRFQQRASSHLSVNTKLYLSLSSCVILFEFISLWLHSTVHNIDNNNSDTQVNSLQRMLFVYNIRCLLFPFLICLTTCDPLKQFLYELLIIRPYLNNIDENDHTDAMIDRAEPFSFLQQTLAKNTNNEHFDNDASHVDL